MTTSSPFPGKTRVWATSISLIATIGLVHAQSTAGPSVPTEPTGPSTGPTGPSTGPTGPSTGPTGPSTGPTGPSTGPTGPSTGPTGPSTGPTGPSPVSPTSTVPTSTVPTNPPSTQPTQTTPPLTTNTSSQTVAPSVIPNPPPSSKSSSSNLPVIVGSVAGVAALIIIIATTIICLRRKKRNNRDLTFDVLQGMNTGSGVGAAAAATSSRTRPSQQHYRAGALPPTSVSAYDDGYDYDSQVGGAGGQGMYGHHHQAYDDTGYDAYGNPHHAYQNPSIFQEDSMAYSNNGRNRGAVGGYDQNLPEIVYRNGNDLIHPSGGATGYYEDDLYNQQLAGANNGWDNQNVAAAGGYIGPKGLWIANPTTEKQYHQQQQQYQDEMELQPPISSTMTYEKNSVTQYDSDTAVDSSSPRSKFRGHNPQALPESPRLQQLRGGDLFGQDGGSPTTPTSPRSANANASVDNVTRAASPPPANSSPRQLSRSDMRSFEMARHSPGRSSNDGIQSYANDLPSSARPSMSDRPSMEGGSNLNPNKSLRTLRREDWS
ncbi:hypothetical protein EC991_010405 [Linnemannia zychae]|nr:hypothetical protein EC991_010405 [Linnemannia zychae]